MNLQIVYGDLLDQDVDVIVNAWNRNVLPWWLLLPQGVSGAIKRRAGIEPFRELARIGPIPLGEARITSAGNLRFAKIIHVAGINLLWRASEQSIRGSVRSALVLAKGYESIAFPIIGSGSGGFSTSQSLEIMSSEAENHSFPGRVVFVRFAKKKKA